MGDVLLNVIASITGLVGVLLGVLVTTRTQRAIAEQEEKRHALAERKQACIEFLSSYRQMRRFIQTQSLSIVMVPHDDGSPATPVIEGAADHWARIDTTTATLEILVDDRTVAQAADNLRHELWELLRVRPDYPPGGFPRTILDPIQTAERVFADAARAALSVAASSHSLPK